jgi:large subunit ribosomal protein L27
VAHKKGQRLGVKIYAGTSVPIGGIIIRQRGTKWHPGRGVRRAKDDTLFAMVEGVVMFDRQGRRVNVIPPQPAGQ